jgi:Xaa-Pro dipeptidase
MDTPIIYGGNQEIVQPNMVIFLHIIIADSENDTAMTLGQSYISGTAGPKELSRHEIDLIVC